MTAELTNTRRPPLFMATPTRSGQVMGATLALFDMVAFSLGRVPVWTYSYCMGLTASSLALSTALKMAISQYEGKEVHSARVLWFEDDIIIEGEDNFNLLREAIPLADKNNWNLVSNYKMKPGPNQNIYYHHNLPPDKCAYTDSEIEALKTYDIVDRTGFGFYYGTLNLDYIWHAEAGAVALDFNYWDDNKTELRHLPLKLKHMKLLPI